MRFAQPRLFYITLSPASLLDDNERLLPFIIPSSLYFHRKCHFTVYAPRLTALIQTTPATLFNIKNAPSIPHAQGKESAPFLRILFIRLVFARPLPLS